MTLKKNSEKVYMGPEPKISGPVSYSDSRIASAFYWYNYFHTVEDGKAWVIQYMKANSYTKDQIDKFARVSFDNITMSLCSLARLHNNGTLLHRSHITTIDRKINAAIATVKPYKKPIDSAAPVVSIQERTREKVDEILAEIDAAIDAFYVAEYTPQSFSAYDTLKKYDAKPAYAKFLTPKYSNLLQELLDADAKKDPQLVEAYAKLKRKQLTNYIAFVKLIVSDLDKYFANKTIARVVKPRKKKAVDASTLLKTFKYLKEFNELKLISFDPANIIGASSVWIYNVKYKKLTVLNANASDKLSIKGTTIVNFDEKTSRCKTVRKPEETLKAVLDSGKVPLKNLMQNIATKDMPAIGRTNEDTILLRYIK